MNNSLLTLVGGSALLLYAIESLSKTIQYFAGSRTRVWINLFAGNRLAGCVLGFVLAIVMGSSGAVTVMLVGLANARLLNLQQVLAVTLGAIVGSTLIVQIMAFQISHYAMLMVTAGVTLGFFTSSDRAKHFSRTILFLGIMFLSMNLIKDAGNVLEQNKAFQHGVQYFSHRPLAALILSTYLTAMIHSSAATIALIMSLLVAQGSTLQEALPWILGANLGTTSTGFLAGFRGGILGKQTALAHFLVKVVGVAVVYPLMSQFAELVGHFGGELERQIANAHTAFNLGLAVLFFPFISLGAKIVVRIIPEKEDTGPFTFHYLDSRSLDTPELALAQAHREILRMSDYVEEMVEKAVVLFENPVSRSIDELREKDQLVDFLNKGIKMHLTRLSQSEMTKQQVHREFELLFRTSDLESIGDVVEKNILPLVKKTAKKGYTFSDEGWGEIVSIHSKVMECLQLSTAFFSSSDRALAVKLALLFEEVEEMVAESNEKHVIRLHQGIKETLDTSSVHLDLVGFLQRIAKLSLNFTQLPDLRGEDR
ncbi:MAG: Na/Pi cotransporter family protein [Bdellovibrionales bacterium]|nr:Na/Pi cotransporter family protein [Bdellovibrionales bacterium]